MAKTNYYTNGMLPVVGEETYPDLFLALLLALQGEFEHRWQTVSGFYTVPTVAAVATQVTVSDLNALLVGLRLTTPGYIDFTGKSAGDYFVQVDGACAFSAATVEDADLLTIATVTWDGTDTLADLALSAMAAGALLTIGNQAAVSSVNGESGDVELDTDDIDEGSNNLYFTVARVQSVIAGMIGAINGVAGLGADGKVPAAQLPAAQPGEGDVSGPASSTDGHIVVFDGATGKVIKGGSLAISAVAAAISALNAHVANFANPHIVTAAQVGNATAQWNADKMLGYTIAIANPQIGQALVWDGENMTLSVVPIAAHASSHASGAGDPITPQAIGAAAANHSHVGYGNGDMTKAEFVTNNVLSSAVDKAIALYTLEGATPRAATAAGTEYTSWSIGSDTNKRIRIATYGTGNDARPMLELTIDNGVTWHAMGALLWSGQGSEARPDTLAAKSRYSLHVTTGGMLELVGDANAPGNNKVYGTDASGNRGWYSPASTIQKYSANVGDGNATSIAITHSLGTRDVTVTVYRVASPYDIVQCDVELTDTNTVTLKFGTAPTSEQYRVVVIG